MDLLLGNNAVNAVLSACVRSSSPAAKERSSCAVYVNFPLTNEGQLGTHKIEHEEPVKNAFFLEHLRVLFGLDPRTEIAQQVFKPLPKKELV